MDDEFTIDEIKAAARMARIYCPGFTEDEFESLMELERHIASRAKDQLVIFHTATLSDLHLDCMRYKLLEYCLNPMNPKEGSTGLPVGE